MIAVQISGIRSFMNQLFLKETFDAFQVSEASFSTFCNIHMDGLFLKEYYSPEELEEQKLAEQTYVFWRQLRPFCLELIRGKHTPLEFRLIFRLSPANVEKLLARAQLSLSPTDVDGLFLNLHYKANQLTCTTGTSLRFFTMDKSLDHAWDDLVKKFFQREHIDFES